MKRIFIFPTIEEAKAFILTQPRDPVFVAGVGAAEIAAATIRAVKARKPQLVVLAGIAGAYDRSLQRGEVVEVSPSGSPGFRHVTPANTKLRDPIWDCPSRRALR